MNTSYKSAPTSEVQVVYVRPVMVESLPDDVRAQIGPIKTVYSVNRPDGERLALVGNRALAFTLARQHDLAPVHAH